MAAANGRKYILYIILSLAVLIIFFLSYFLATRKKDNPYSFVPENAVMVWESQNTYSSVSKMQDGSIWQNLSQLPFYTNVTSRLALIDSLDEETQALKFFLKDKFFRVSMHITSSDNFDFIFYIPLESKEDKEIFKEVFSRFKKSSNHRISERAFQNTPITTLSNKTSGEQFAFISYQNHIIGSMTPFLVEDVIRHVKGERKSSFYDINKKNFEIAHIKNDDGDLYVNNERFADFLQCFVKSEYQPELELIRQFSQSAFFDLSINDNKIYLNGTTIPSKDFMNYLDIFKGESSQSLKLAQYIPMNTAVYYGFSFDNGISFQQNLKHFLKNSGNSKTLEAWYNLSVNENIYIEKIYEFMGSHFAYITLESENPSRPVHLFYIDSNDPQENLNYLRSISEKFSKKEEGELPFEENYRGVLITEMKKEDYPKLAFSDYFGGFGKSYFFNIDDYIIFSNDIPAARQLIDDISDEKVWGKSVKQNLFFEELIQETNVNIIINTPRVWSLVKHISNKNWIQYFTENADFFKGFELFALQYAYLDDKFYTGAVIQHRKSLPKKKIQKEELDKRMTLKLENKIITRPKVVRNHNDNTFELLVQDEKKQLHLISNKGEILWKKPIKGTVLSESITQIDFYKNGKLQYCFSDSEHIYIIDRNGDPVEEFPIKIAKGSNQELLFFNVIDYDNTKNYRFICADNKGNVFITDKFGKILEGWDPLKLDFPLAARPDHVRIMDKDIIVLLTVDGKLDLKKRNGISYSGFPVDLYNRVSTEYFVDLNKGFEKSSVHVLDEQGLLKEVNFEGKIISETQFFRPDNNTRFELVRDGLGKTYCVSRISLNSVEVLDRRKNELFKIEQSAKSDVQYYNFGADNELFIILDPENSKAQLLRADGSLLLRQGLNSGSELAVLYYDSYERFHVYRVFDNEISLITFEN